VAGTAVKYTLSCC